MNLFRRKFATGLLLLAMVPVLFIGCKSKEKGTVASGERNNTSSETGSASEQISQAEDDAQAEKSTELDEDTLGGGNSFVNEDIEKEVLLEVMIVGGEYYFNKKEMDLEALMKIVTETDGNVTVSISENKATLRAYDNLKEALNSAEIPFIEE